MGWIRRLVDLLGLDHSRQAQQLAVVIAHRGLATVWQRVSGQVANMQPSEARGYIRARAAQVIHAEANRVVDFDRAIPSKYRAELIQLATNEVLRLTVRQWMTVRTARSQPIVRRAA